MSDQRDGSMRLPLLQLGIRRMLTGVALLAILMACGVGYARQSRLRFDFSDYQDVAEEPLINPTEFFGLEENRVDLGGGRYLAVEATTWTYDGDPEARWLPGDRDYLSAGLEEELANLGAGARAGTVGLGAAPDGRVLLYVRNQPWSCGTGLGPVIHIPLFRRRVYTKRQLLIGMGRIINREEASRGLAGRDTSDPND